MKRALFLIVFLFSINVVLGQTNLSDSDLCRLIIAEAINVEPTVLSVNKRSNDYHVSYVSARQKVMSLKCLVEKNKLLWGPINSSYNDIRNRAVNEFEYVEHENETMLQYRRIYRGYEDNATIIQISIPQYLKEKKLKVFHLSSGDGRRLSR